jgi:hypothetical protein
MCAFRANTAISGACDQTLWSKPRFYLSTESDAYISIERAIQFWNPHDWPIRLLADHKRSKNLLTM